MNRALGMNFKKILLVTISLCITFMFLVISSPVSAKNAEYVNIIGSDKTAILSTWLEESTWDWSYGKEKYSITNVNFVPSFSPYWDDINTLTYQSADKYKNEIPFVYKDVFNATLGVAFYPSGDVFIDSKITNIPLLKEVIVHELAHARVWFVWMARHPDIKTEWESIVKNGIDTNLINSSWYFNPAESHAEWHRISYNDISQMYDTEARTNLTNPGNIVGVINFHNWWCYGIKPPNTPPIPADIDVSITDESPYRTLFDRTSEFLPYWRIKGTYSGDGEVWLIPNNWGDFAPLPTKATKLPDGTWVTNLYCPGDTGPMYLPITVRIEYTNLNYLEKQYKFWFDLTEQCWPDIPTNDWELYCGGYYIKQTQLFLGKLNGNISPYEHLTKRHIYIVSQRAGLTAPSNWINNYSLATRGNVRDSFPSLTWNETRWNENITRGQFIRLLWRSHINK